MSKSARVRRGRTNGAPVTPSDSSWAGVPDRDRTIADELLKRKAAAELPRSGPAVRVFTYEWMHRFVGSNSVIRVWAKAKPLEDPGRGYEFTKQHVEIGRLLGQAQNPQQVLPTLQGIEYVTAIEILDVSGNGAIVYADWP